MKINIEYRDKSGFSSFFNFISDKRVALLYDVNTAPYALGIEDELSVRGCSVVRVAYPDEELVPTEAKCAESERAARECDYVLAVGSGTLNDMAKSAATLAGVPSGVLATAASMDGYCSSGAALMRGGFKVTDTVNAPRDILIDLDIVRRAPRIMTAAGFGDIIGKYTCLADWRLASIVKGEPIHTKAYEMMERARDGCVQAYESLTEYTPEAVESLMNALVAAGLSMFECGNSRPASGSEHHQSHYLEMDFVRRGERVPLHGLKVGIGTLVSLAIYDYLARECPDIEHADEISALASSLPSEQKVRRMLEGMGCPTRFSEIGVREQTAREMLYNAYTVRDRFTVLTLVHELDLSDKIVPMLMERYY